MEIVARKQPAEKYVNATLTRAIAGAMHDLDESDKQLKILTNRFEGFRENALAALAYASKDTFERLFDWKGKGAGEYMAKQNRYRDLVYEASRDIAGVKAIVKEYDDKFIGGTFVLDNVRKYKASKAENFTQWAKANPDPKVRRFGEVMGNLEKSSDQLKAKLIEIQKLHEELKVETALSVGMAIASVIPSGSVVSKGVAKLISTEAKRAAQRAAKETFKRRMIFAAGFVADNAVGDIVGAKLTGADTSEVVKQAFPSYILALGLIGGSKALAAELGKNKPVSALFKRAEQPAAAPQITPIRIRRKTTPQPSGQATISSVPVKTDEARTKAQGGTAMQAEIEAAKPRIERPKKIPEAETPAATEKTALARTFRITSTKKFDKDVEKLVRENSALERILEREKAKIAEYPWRHKPLSNSLKGYRRCHIANSYVLAYKISGDDVLLLRLVHHDVAYPTAAKDIMQQYGR
ncbi:Bacterial toxin of type II toxin-antitoxin system, YafQ [uncultured archaeon]|nr:Bacterial toxin of type II toxin-antitoxin system, YafQ [uncultured archaeon]